MDYEKFLENKKLVFNSAGIDISKSDLHPSLKDFQVDLTYWSIRKGRAAIFASTGLGKTRMQIEPSRIYHEYTKKPSLIIAPLSVARQTVNEAHKMDIDIHFSRDGSLAPLTITNYEMAEKFNPYDLGMVALDESSILKNVAGKTRQKLTDMYDVVPYRFCYTATPNPNDDAEMASHSEFLGIMTRNNMMSSFFVHDQDGWRLRKWAEHYDKYYEWLASWAMAIRKPSDLGYSDDGYDLPRLNVIPHRIETDYRPAGQLFVTQLKGITHRSAIRRETMEVRCRYSADIVNQDKDQWIVWCNLNTEADLMTKLCEGAVNLQGSDSIDQKLEKLDGFIDGNIRVLVTKPKIAGFGMNFQNSHKQITVGVDDSWESYHQRVRRQWRYGQEMPVDAHFVFTHIEEQIWENLQKKQERADKMLDNLIKNVQKYEMVEVGKMDTNNTYEYKVDERSGDGWNILLGDSCERLKEFEDNSIDFTVFSPPFDNLYAYTPTERDIGNSASNDDFLIHFGFIVDELMRVLKPGRVAAVHVMDIPAMLVRDGYIGLKDFSGDIVRLFTGKGWTYDGRVPIDKNQQMQSIRTHSKGLTMTQKNKDRSWSRPALPDYILKFRKPGENEVYINDDSVDNDTWIEIANPTWPGGDGKRHDRAADQGAFATWYGIRESDLLSGWNLGRDEKDEKHVCPLQMETIERCIRLWSNKGELVLDPFLGIGSTVAQAVALGRRGVGIELKDNWFYQAERNIRALQEKMEYERRDMFSQFGIEFNGNAKKTYAAELPVKHDLSDEDKIKLMKIEAYIEVTSGAEIDISNKWRAILNLEGYQKDIIVAYEDNLISLKDAAMALGLSELDFKGLVGWKEEADLKIEDFSKHSIIEVYHEGIIKPSEAADLLGLSVDDFIEETKQADLQVSMF